MYMIGCCLVTSEFPRKSNQSGTLQDSDLLMYFLDCLDCDFSTLPSEITVKDMSKAGNVQFGGEAPDGCLSGLQVTQWSYRLDKPQEIIGQPNNFRVITDGRNRNRWSLQVSKKASSSQECQSFILLNIRINYTA